MIQQEHGTFGGVVMEIGNYVNLFPVNFDNTSFKVVRIEREKYPSLRELRASLKSCSVYAVENKVYGFGTNFKELTSLGFTEVVIDIQEVLN